MYTYVCKNTLKWRWIYLVTLWFIRVPKSPGKCFSRYFFEIHHYWGALTHIHPSIWCHRMQKRILMCLMWWVVCCLKAHHPLRIRDKKRRKRYTPCNTHTHIYIYIYIYTFPLISSSIFSLSLSKLTFHSNHLLNITKVIVVPALSDSFVAASQVVSSFRGTLSH